MKVNAGRLAFASIFGSEEGDEASLEVEGFNVSSGVPDQPVGEEQTREGALNRAIRCYDEFIAAHGNAPDFAVGMEGGIDGMNEGDTMKCFAVMCVYNGTSKGFARTATFDLPEKIGVLVRGGMELGSADDEVFKTVNSKQGQGTVGALTNGVISRTDYYVPAIVLAHVPFNFPTLYPSS